MFDVVHILSNTIKKGVQAKKIFGHQTMFDRVCRQSFSILVELSIPVYVVIFLIAVLLKSSLKQQKCVL